VQRLHALTSPITINAQQFRLSVFIVERITMLSLNVTPDIGVNMRPFWTRSGTKLSVVLRPRGIPFDTRQTRLAISGNPTDGEVAYINSTLAAMQPVSVAFNCHDDAWRFFAECVNILDANRRAIEAGVA
jgi:hypothetical protein